MLSRFLLYGLEQSANQEFRRSSIWAVRFLTSCFIIHKLSQYLLGEDEEDEKELNPGSKSPQSLSNGQAKKDPGANGAEEDDEGLLIELPDELPEDAIFIPLWWGKERPRKFYKGSDPEWKSYVKFARDKAKTQAVRMVLATHVKDVVEGNKSWVRFLGSPVQFHRIWLDYDFPLGPPPEYERLGIEIGDDYVGITTRLQTDRQHTKVKNILWPESMAQSLWASIQMYCSLQYLRAKHKFDQKFSMNKSHDESTNPSGLPPPDTTFDLQKMTTKSPSQQGPGKIANLPGADKSTTTPSPSPEQDPKSSKASANNTNERDIDYSKFPFHVNITKFLHSLPPFSSKPNDLQSAMKAFEQTLMRTWKPALYVDKGIVVISGLVEIGGSKGVVVVDVLATYHPEMNEMKIKSLSPRRMNPKRLNPKDRG